MNNTNNTCVVDNVLLPLWISSMFVVILTCFLILTIYTYYNKLCKILTKEFYWCTSGTEDIIALLIYIAALCGTSVIYIFDIKTLVNKDLHSAAILISPPIFAAILISYMTLICFMIGDRFLVYNLNKCKTSEQLRQLLSDVGEWTLVPMLVISILAIIISSLIQYLYFNSQQSIISCSDTFYYRLIIDGLNVMLSLSVCIITCGCGSCVILINAKNTSKEKESEKEKVSVDENIYTTHLDTILPSVFEHSAIYASTDKLIY